MWSTWLYMRVGLWFFWPFLPQRGSVNNIAQRAMPKALTWNESPEGAWSRCFVAMPQSLFKVFTNFKLSTKTERTYWSKPPMNNMYVRPSSTLGLICAESGKNHIILCVNFLMKTCQISYMSTCLKTKKSGNRWFHSNRHRPSNFLSWFLHVNI